MNLKDNNFIDFKVYNITRIKNKYGYRINLVFPDGSNTCIQKSGYKTKREANESRNNSIAELYNKNFILQNNVTVKTFFTDWLENYKKLKITHNSYISYKNIVYNHIITSLGNIKMTSLNRGHIQSLYNSKVEYSHSVAKLCKTVMNSAMKYALFKNFINSDISADVNLDKSVKKRKYRTEEIDIKKTLTLEQTQTLIESSKNSPIYMQVLFACLMGLRKSEINGLKYSDINYINRKIKIQRQLGTIANSKKEDYKAKQFTKQEIKCKTFSSKRELYIPDVVFEAILEERKIYDTNKYRRKKEFRDLDYICCSSYGNPRSSSYHFKYWKDLLKENNLPNIRFHDLRATYCTLLIKNDFNLKAVSNLMGHSTEIISVDIYGNNKEIISDCIEELDPFIESVTPKKEKTNLTQKEENEILNITENLIGYLVNWDEF